ncbi:MAG TPA: hypothetical protein VK747_03605 [Blastocatellia bacterium]|nr:hypothetical protein [Blastocatellia bacterium]
MGLIKELQDSLFARVAKEVDEYRFDRRSKTHYSFYKKTPLGRQAFSLPFIRHAPTDVDVTAEVAIRFDDVEDLVNEHKSLLTEAQKRNTYTLGAELGNISEGRQKRWSLASRDAIDNVARSIMEAFAAIGRPYLEKYSAMESALEALSQDDKTAQLHSPFHDERAMRAIAIAFVLGDRERFLSIAAAKTQILAGRNDDGLQRFLQLRDVLERRLL